MKRLIGTTLLAILAVYCFGQNTAIKLDGSSEYLTIDHKDNQNIGQAYTIEAWIFANSWATEVWRGSIINKDNQGPDRGFGFRCGDNGKLNWVIAVDNTWFETTTPSLMNAKQWHHVAGTVNGKTVKLYIDGQEVASQTFSGTPSPLPQDLYIGNSTGFDGRNFDGVIDEVRIWNVARTQSEIAANANVDLTGTETGLVIYLPMNEGSGSVATNLVDATCSATGVGIDDSNWVDGYTLPDYDLSVRGISGIDYVNMKSRPVRLKVNVQNVGLQSMKDYTLDVLVDGSVAISETISNDLSAGDALEYTFDTPLDLTETGATDLEIIVNHPDDANALNNSTEEEIYNASGNIVSIFRNEPHNFGGDGQNKFKEIILPSDLSKYETLLLHIDLNCPSGGCDPWDQPAKVIAQTENGNFEIARYITPYGVACGPWTIDVTDFKSILQGGINYNSFIQVWGPNGWLVDIDLELVEGNAAHPFSKVTSLWQQDYHIYGDPGISHDLASKSLVVENNTDISHIRMQVSGHGQGNTNNAAEFFNVNHELTLGGQTFATHNLWKDDCEFNICSNQAGSWLYDRAGWCPGQEVIPAIFNTSSQANPGSTVELDYELQSYVNLLNTGYNNSGHTEPHYRIHGFFVEQSTQRYEDFDNLEIVSVETEGTGDIINTVKITVLNSGNVSVDNYAVRYFFNNTMIESEDISASLAPGASNVVNFTFTGSLVGGTNYFFGEVQYNTDQNPGDNLAMETVDFMSSTFNVEIANQYTVQPNPSNGHVFIQLEDVLLGSQLEVYTIHGHLVMYRKIQSQKEILDLDQAGTYLITVRTPEAYSATKKVVVID